MVATIPVEEIKEIADEELAKAQAVAKIKGEQLKELADKTAKMSKENAEKFMDNVAAPALEEAITKFGESKEWTKETTPVVVNKLKNTWGASKTRTSEKVDKLNEMVATIPVEEIKEIADEELAKAQAVAKIKGEQLKELADKTAKMSKENAEKFMDNVAAPALEEAITKFGESKEWTKE